MSCSVWINPLWQVDNPASFEVPERLMSNSLKTISQEAVLEKPSPPIFIIYLTKMGLDVSFFLIPILRSTHHIRPLGRSLGDLFTPDTLHTVQYTAGLLTQPWGGGGFDRQNHRLFVAPIQYF